MSTRNAIAAVSIAALLSVVPILLYASANGADAGYSSAPSEQNCASCHDSGSGNGSLAVSFPNGPFYTPGTSQQWTVTVSDPIAQSWGFQLVARQDTNRSAQAGTQAGSFTPGSDGNTQVVCDDSPTDLKKETFITSGSCPSNLPLEWIEQTSQGAQFGVIQSASFTFTWNPPSSNVGAIDIYISAVAGAGGDSTAGSKVYNGHYILTVPVPNQPSITQGGVVNGAGFQNSIAANTWVTITGTNLANTTRPWNSGDLVNGQLPTSLDGVSVTIGGVSGFVQYVSPTQVNVLAAPAIPTGTGITVELVNNGLSSFPGSVNALTIAPALFLWKSKYAAATRTDFSYVGPAGLFANATTTPAKSGDTIILWATGLGATFPPIPDGTVTPSGETFNLLHPPMVTIAGVGAQVVGTALAPGFAGLYQIAIQIPNGIANGDQPIVVQSGSVSSPSGVFLTIQN